MPGRPVAAAQWHDQLAEPFRHGSLDTFGQVSVVRYRDIDARIDQPALLENVLSIHLGGAKRVTRWSGRQSTIHDVALNALTIMPAVQSYRWRTEGPVDFAHVAIGPALLGQLAIEEFDRHPFDLALRDEVGLVDPAVATLFNALLVDIDRPVSGRLYRQSLLTALGYHLLRDHSTISSTPGAAAPGSRTTRRVPTGRQGKTTSRGGMAGWQLRRVLDFMQAHMADDIQLAELVALTGTSRAHFFRAFHETTGSTPYSALTDIRVRSASRLLRSTTLPVSVISARVGLAPAQLYSVFRRRTGLSPSAYRRSVGGL